MSSGVLNLTLQEVLYMMRYKHISSTELCNLCLARLRATSELNAFLTVNHRQEADDESISSGALSDGEGTLAGIPVAVKDNFATKNSSTTCASQTLRNFHPPYNATIIKRILEHQAIILGKTNLDEFAMGSGNIDSIYGPVRNPWRYTWNQHSSSQKTDIPTSCRNVPPVDVCSYNKPETDFYIAGGSSGGSAVAVATGSVFAALGSDTSGSTRVPAAFCGVPALKPTYGLVSRHGLISLVNSMDVPGIIAKTINDITEVLNVVAGWDVNDSTTVRNVFPRIDLTHDTDIRNLHIALPKEFDQPSLRPEISAMWRSVADALSNNGAKVTWMSLPHCLHAMTCYQVLTCCEIASNFARYDGLQYGHRASNNKSTEEMYSQTRHESLNDVVRGRILAGNYFLLKQNYEKYFIQAQKARRLISNDLRAVFTAGADAVLSPATPCDAPKYSALVNNDNREASQDIDQFTGMANLAGLPATVVPCTLSENDLPLCIQLVAPAFNEQPLLALSKHIEQIVNFPRLDLSFLDNVP